MPGPRRLALASLALTVVMACGGGGSPTTGTAPAAERDAGQEPQAPASAGAAEPAQARRGLRLATVGRFREPVFVTAPPGDRRRLFVVEKGGTIRVLRGGRRLSRPFLDVSGRISSSSEQGLLSLAFAPDYASSKRFYVYLTTRDGTNQIEEFRAAGPERADPASRRVVLSQPDSERNHNGGLLLFGPDRLLYAGLGDGGGGGDEHGARGNGQDLGTVLGKILRIDPRPAGGRPYRIPSSNPFVRRAGARAEIYAYGLRNPWRFSFDRSTGDIAIGDVGQNEIEEVDFLRRGRARGVNFGWRPFEGSARFRDGESAPGHVRPVIELRHSEGNCSVTGGYVVRDRALADLNGRYVFGDYCAGRLLSARLRPGRRASVSRTSLTVPQLSSFGEDARGRVYATSLEGPVYRLASR